MALITNGYKILKRMKYNRWFIVGANLALILIISFYKLEFFVYWAGIFTFIYSYFFNPGSKPGHQIASSIITWPAQIFVIIYFWKTKQSPESALAYFFLIATAIGISGTLASFLLHRLIKTAAYRNALFSGLIALLASTSFGAYTLTLHLAFIALLYFLLSYVLLVYCKEKHRTSTLLLVFYLPDFLIKLFALLVFGMPEPKFYPVLGMPLIAITAGFIFYKLHDGNNRFIRNRIAVLIFAVVFSLASYFSMKYFLMRQLMKLTVLEPSNVELYFNKSIPHSLPVSKDATFNLYLIIDEHFNKNVTSIKHIIDNLSEIETAFTLHIVFKDIPGKEMVNYCDAFNRTVQCSETKLNEIEFGQISKELNINRMPHLTVVDSSLKIVYNNSIRSKDYLGEIKEIITSSYVPHSK